MSTIKRTYHAVDIENILALTHGMAIGLRAGELYKATVGFGPGDLIEVAADVTRVFQARAAFPGAKVLHGVGRDGADRALIASIDLDHIAGRFDSITIASGDHAFVDLAYRARRRGLEVIVVSRPSCLSRVLAPYADIVIDMPEFDTTPEFIVAA